MTKAEEAAMGLHAPRGISAQEVQDRNGLNEYLRQSLIGDYIDYVGDDEFSQRAPHLKTYVVESNEIEGRSIEARLLDHFRVVSPRNDGELLLLIDKHEVPYFADLANPRYLAIHTTGRANLTDAAITKITTSERSGFDRSWLPAEHLQKSTRGQLMGFKFGFEWAVDGVTPFEFSDLDLLPSSRLKRNPRFRMTVAEDAFAKHLFDQVVSSDVGIGRRALEHVNFLSADQTNDYIRDVVYSTGKIIGSGTSLNGHYLTVNTVMRTYSETITFIEEHATGWKRDEDSWRYVGEPFVIAFPRTLTESIFDLEAFARSIFRPTQPFRLIGLPHNVTSERVDIEAVDLHTNDPFSVELTSEHMLIYLPIGACGNVLARLFTNMQHTADSGITLSTGSGEPVFAGDIIDAS